MTGSEKQVTWAEQIQEQWKSEYTQLAKEALRGDQFRVHPEWRPDLIKAYERAWNDEQSAAWWIEHRHAAHIAVQEKARAIFKEMHH